MDIQRPRYRPGGLPKGPPPPMPVNMPKASPGALWISVTAETRLSEMLRAEGALVDSDMEEAAKKVAPCMKIGREVCRNNSQC